MVPGLVTIASMRLAMPMMPCKMFLNNLNGMEHCVQMQLGQSTEEYWGDLGEQLFGTGQGSGGSLVFWLATSETILNTMDNCTLGSQ